MLDNGTITIIMNINLNTSQSILKINQVSLSPAATKQLIPRQVCVMRRVAMIIIEWFCCINLAILIIFTD